MSQKLEKLKLDLVKFTELGKLEVGYFGELRKGHMQRGRGTDRRVGR